MIATRRVKALLPGIDALLYDKAAHGEDIDELFELGIHLHAKVSLANKAKNTPKERLTDVGLPAIRNGDIVGEVDIVARGGAAHIRVNIGGDWQLVLLEPGQVHQRRSRKGDKVTRVWRDYRIPDDPLVPQRLRGAIVKIRHMTDDVDRKRGLNRAEILRLIAEDHSEWDLVAQRNRAESLNQWVKRHWPDKRGPAVGKERQLMRLTFASIGLNIIAALHQERRTGISILGPPGPHAAAA